jgi:dihydroorotate dehydrogenase (NAD+) catalytic subunit
MMLAGASAVEMSSNVMLRGAASLSDALGEFESYLARKRVQPAELIGLAADRRKAFADMPLRPENWRKYVAI